MKKLMSLAVAICCMFGFAQNVNAQRVEKFGMFDHFSAAVTLGLGGIGFDAGTCIGEYVQARVGGQFFPGLKYTTDFTPEIEKTVANSYTQTSFDQNVDVTGKFSFNSGKVLVDVFPFPQKSSFHVTAGFYFGGGDIISISNDKSGIFNDLANEYNTKNNIPASNLLRASDIGVALGDYFLAPDNDGNMEAGIEINSFRPYLGIGFGRAVPRKRVGFMFELGVQFWGSPKIYVEGANGRYNPTAEDYGSDDGGLTKTLSDITIYPMMTFRLCGRIL